MFGLFPEPRRYRFTATCPCGAMVDTTFLTGWDHTQFAGAWLSQHQGHQQMGLCEVAVDGPGGPLNCTLMSGHKGAHRDRSGASWSP